MAGIKLTVNDDEIRVGLNTLASLLDDLSTPLAQIGEHLQISTRERFRTQQAPDGTPWKPLSKEYQSKKRKNQSKILTLDGYLQGRLKWQINNDGVALTSNQVYAATHQFGMKKGYAGRGQYKTRKGSFPIPWGDIPARPFLGLSEQDKQKVLTIINKHFNSAIPK